MQDDSKSKTQLIEELQAMRRELEAERRARQEAEEAQRLSERRFQRYFENSPYGIVLCDMIVNSAGDAIDFVHLEANAATTVQTGWQLDAIVGRRASEMVTPEVLTQLLELYGPLISGGKPVSYIQHFDLYERTLQVSAFQLDGTQFILNFRDISELKQVEKENHAYIAFLDSIMEQSPFAMWISDTTGTVIRTNRALRETLNLRDEQILGQYNVLQDENLKETGVMAEVRTVFEKQRPTRFSIPWIAARAGDVDFSGGRDRWIDASLFPLVDSEKHLTNVVCQWVDISERKRAEKALQESNAGFRRLAGGIGYELRNPLGVISNAVYYLSALLCDADDTIREYLEILHLELQSANQTVSDLLAASQVKPLQQSMLSVQQLVTQALNACPPPASIHVDTALDPELPGLYADKQQLAQVLRHLLLNAYQAMPEGGTLTIGSRQVAGGGPGSAINTVARKTSVRAAPCSEPVRAELVEAQDRPFDCSEPVRAELVEAQDKPFDCSEPVRAELVEAQDKPFDKLRANAAQLDTENCVLISFQDTGCGMDRENLSQVFEPLFTTKQRAIGLGLTICQNLVEANGGGIQVDSREGKGTTVTLLFPNEEVGS